MKDADAKVVVIMALSKQIRQSDYREGVQPEVEYERDIHEYLEDAPFPWVGEIFESHLVEDPNANIPHVRLEPQDVEDLVALLSRPYIDDYSSEEWLEVARRLPKIRTKLRWILGEV